MSLSLALLVSMATAGLLGSFHCVAMCGAFGLAASRRGTTSSLVYSLGRLTSYSILGAVAGTAGASLQVTLHVLGEFSAAIAIVVGVVLVLLGIRAMTPAGAVRFSLPPLEWLYASLVPLVRVSTGVRGPGQAYTLGVLNGLLPCPVVTPLLLAAFATSSALGGAALLCALGLGTLPAMLGAAHGGGRLLNRVLVRGEQDWRTTQWGGRLTGLAMLILGTATAVRPLLSSARHMHGM